MSAQLSLQFLGAAGTVTGSKHLLTVGHKKILIDCGLFQGLKPLRRKNWDPLPIDPRQIDAVILTHGHLDHVGYLPRLLKDGFRGAILATAPTVAVATVVLRDSARLQEEEASEANERGYSKHKPAQPLYSVADAEFAISRLQSIEAHTPHALGPDLTVTFHPNGHIIGSCYLDIQAQGKHLIFSGDVGRRNDPLLPNPEQPNQADVLLLESTYGNRAHPVADPGLALGEAIRITAARQGTIFLPSFAVERTQLLLALLQRLRSAGDIPDIPIILDTPMGKEVLRLFSQYPEWHHLSLEDCQSLTHRVRVVEHFNETLKLAKKPGPRIILSGSGMLTGGRILTYLETGLEDPANTVALTGFQAEGTRGRDLLEGKPVLRIRGRDIPVRAEIVALEGLSAHADQPELLQWLDQLKEAPQHLFLVHGEPVAQTALQSAIFERYGWNAQIPQLGDYHPLT